jgi:hypothetical protein
MCLNLLNCNLSAGCLKKTLGAFSRLFEGSGAWCCDPYYLYIVRAENRCLLGKLCIYVLSVDGVRPCQNAKPTEAGA